MDIYREEILDHYKNPRNFSIPRRVRGKWRFSEVKNIACGDMVKLGVKLEVTNLENIVKDIRFEGEGCAVSMASTSMLTEMVKGKSLKELEKIDEKLLLKRIGIPISSARRKCVRLGFEAFKKIIK